MKYRLINKQTNEEHLCDKVTIDGFDYYVNDFISDEVNGDLTKIPFEKLILIAVASNNPNIDIPKVVDEVERTSLLESMGNAVYMDGYKNGYNKSQETHPNSDEDVKSFGAHFYTRRIQGIEETIDQSLQLWKEQRIKTIYYE